MFEPEPLPEPEPGAGQTPRSSFEKLEVSQTAMNS